MINVPFVMDIFIILFILMSVIYFTIKTVEFIIKVITIIFKRSKDYIKRIYYTIKLGILLYQSNVKGKGV